MVEKKAFILAVSSLLMILCDSEMTTQMRLAYKVYLNSVGSANSLVLRCPLHEGSVRASRRTPGVGNPGGRGLKYSQCSAVSFSRTLLLGPFRFGFLWNAAAELGWCDLSRAGTSSSWVQCSKWGYRRLRSPNPKGVLKDTWGPHVALWNYQNIWKHCWVTWKHMGLYAHGTVIGHP